MNKVIPIPQENVPRKYSQSMPVDKWEIKTRKNGKSNMQGTILKMMV